MKQAYSDWIDSYVASVQGHTLGKCGAATASMVEAFPELRAVRGHVDTDYGRRSHWWCMTSSGEIIDPTASQFNVIFEYIEFSEGDPERLGKCMNCGDEIWAPRDKGICPIMCSRRCGEIFMREEMEQELPNPDPNIYVADTEWGRSGEQDDGNE